MQNRCVQCGYRAATGEIYTPSGHCDHFFTNPRLPTRQIRMVADVAFCWVEVVIHGSDDILRGILELLSFPFRQVGDNLQVLCNPSSARPTLIGDTRAAESLVGA